MQYSYQYPRPAVTTDAVLFSGHHDGWQVLLIQRKNAPYRDHWALPGGFLDDNEDPDHGVARELEEETSLTGIELEPLGFWGRPGRDPRGHTVSLAYWAIVDGEQLQPVAADDARALAWHRIDALPKLAFDHADIVRAGRDKLPPGTAPK